MQPDLSVTSSQHLAPASAPFLEATTAFARGTLIDTVRGPLAIEDLMPGDYVRTAEGSEPVLWIGSTSYTPRPVDGAPLQLIRITGDALGLGRPVSDVIAGPAARIVLRKPDLRRLIGRDAVSLPLSDFVDGDRVFHVTPPSPQQLFHVQLRTQSALRICGLEMESFHPGRESELTRNAEDRAQFLAMFPSACALGDFGDLSFPRITREVLDRLLEM